MMRFSRRWAFWCYLVIGAFYTAVWPATAATTGQLQGLVFDEQSGPLQGVTILASAPTQIGGDQQVLTDSDGWFYFPNLAPGFFTVHCSLDGHVRQEINEVQVRVDRVTELRIDLPVATFGETTDVIEVTPMLDPEQISTGQTFSDLYISETVAMFGDWRPLISQAAGTDTEDSRRILGSVPDGNTYLLDSMDATNKWVRNPAPVSTALPVDALQEVALHSSGFEAEYGQATGGVINVVTKSGGNDFHGTVDLRYSDNDFVESGIYYDPDEQVSENQRAGLTLGGPILRDRLWFFGAYGLREFQTTPTGSPTTATTKGDVFFGKLNWQMKRSWTILGKLAYNPVSEENFNSSPFVSPEATATYKDDSAIGSAELSGVLSSSVLWISRLNRQDYPYREEPSDGDLVTIGHADLYNGEYFGNYASQGRWEDIDNELASEVNWFVGNLAGSHDVRAGVRLATSSYTDNVCLNGNGLCQRGNEGFRFLDWEIGGEPVPYYMRQKRAEGERNFGGDFQAVFAQDAWRIRPDLTLKIGLRWDRSTYNNNTGQVADLHKLQPRIGAAWNLTRNGRNLLRASWGRYMSPGTLFLSFLSRASEVPQEYWYSCTDFGFSDPDDCIQIANDWDLGYRTDPEGWDPVGWVLFPEDIVGSEANQIAANLQPMFVDQWMVGFERELFRRSTLEVSYVSKTGTDLFEDTCNGNYPVPSSDAACDFFLIANLPGLRSEYSGWLLRFETSALDRMQLLASWVISDSKGSVNYGDGATPDYDYYPWLWDNRYGYLADQSRHRVKLSGFTHLPLDFSLAVNGWWSSEFRWTPFGSAPPGSGVSSVYRVFLEPRGSRQGNSRGNLDIQIGKGFRIGPTQLRLLGSVFNLLDSEKATAVCGRVTGCGDTELGDPIAWQQPRSYELGLRVEF